MTIKEKLTYFKGRINTANGLNAELKNLIGIELFDFIYSNDLLKTEFERRRDYLKNLADNTGFNSIQDNLFETIQKILKLTSLEEVQERQKIWGNALFNRLKNNAKREERVPDVLTLPEMYVALQDKNNYYRLKDNSYYSPFDGEISLINHIVPVKKQYEVIVEGFFREVFSSKLADNNKKGLKLKELFNEYNDYWYKFDELIYRIPVKLHFKSFEDFFSDCTEFCIREGYEFHYNFFANSNSRNTEVRLIKVKKDAVIVIDDLIEFAELETAPHTLAQGKAIKEKVEEYEKGIKSEQTTRKIVVEELEKINKTKKANKTDKIVLCLNKDGELWREPKNKYCYPIEKNSDRLKILNFFVDSEIYEYFPTSEMAKHFELTIKNLSNQIGNIRSIAGARLNLKYKLLEGAKDSGYRISSKYKITKKDK